MVQATSSLCGKAAYGKEGIAPNQPVDYRNVGEGNIVYTSPLNGATVTDHFAGAFSATIISGDPEGVHTTERTFQGLIHLYRTDGGVLYQGAGYVVVHDGCVVAAEG